MNNTLITGLQVLEFLARQVRPLGVTEISQQLGLAKSNAHRILQSLTEHNYIIKHDDAKTYTASLKLWELGYEVMERLDIKAHAEPAMEELLALANETVHLSVCDRHEVIYVHKLESTNPVRAYTEIGGRALAHCVATGKAMLACLPDPALQRFSQSLPSATPASIVDPNVFMKEMQRIRSHGYAVNHGEWRERVSGVAAAIRGAHGQAIAAIGLSGPSNRFTEERINAFATLCRQAANSIEARLAGTAGRG